MRPARTTSRATLAPPWRFPGPPPVAPPPPPRGRRARARCRPGRRRRLRPASRRPDQEDAARVRPRTLRATAGPRPARPALSRPHDPSRENGGQHSPAGPHARRARVQEDAALATEAGQKQRLLRTQAVETDLVRRVPIEDAREALDDADEAGRVRVLLKKDLHEPPQRHALPGRDLPEAPAVPEHGRPPAPAPGHGLAVDALHLPGRDLLALGGAAPRPRRRRRHPAAAGSAGWPGAVGGEPRGSRLLLAAVIPPAQDVERVGKQRQEGRQAVPDRALPTREIHHQTGAIVPASRARGRPSACVLRPPREAARRSRARRGRAPHGWPRGSGRAGLGRCHPSSPRDPPPTRAEGVGDRARSSATSARLTRIRPRSASPAPPARTCPRVPAGRPVADRDHDCVRHGPTTLSGPPACGVSRREWMIGHEGSCEGQSYSHPRPARRPPGARRAYPGQDAPSFETEIEVVNFNVSVTTPRGSTSPTCKVDDSRRLRGRRPTEDLPLQQRGPPHLAGPAGRRLRLHAAQDEGGARRRRRLREDARGHAIAPKLAQFSDRITVLQAFTATGRLLLAPSSAPAPPDPRRCTTPSTPRSRSCPRRRSRRRTEAPGHRRPLRRRGHRLPRHRRAGDRPGQEERDRHLPDHAARAAGQKATAPRSARPPTCSRPWPSRAADGLRAQLPLRASTGSTSGSQRSCAPSTASATCPSNPRRDGKWRRIVLRIPSRAGLTVRHRSATTPTRADRGPVGRLRPFLGVAYHESVTSAPLALVVFGGRGETTWIRRTIRA